MCGEEIEAAIASAGVKCDRHLMDGLCADAFDPYSLLVIVTSTYGHGEIPDNGQALFAAIEAGADLSGKDFVVFALGDRTYSDTFCAAGDAWDMIMQQKGGRRLIDIKRHDASSGTLAEDVAGEWAAGWVAQLR
jgi:MioC protein